MQGEGGGTAQRKRGGAGKVIAAMAVVLLVGGTATAALILTDPTGESVSDEPVAAGQAIATPVEPVPVEGEEAAANEEEDDENFESLTVLPIHSMGGL